MHIYLFIDFKYYWIKTFELKLSTSFYNKEKHNNYKVIFYITIMTNINYFFLNYVHSIIILIMLLFYIQNNWYNTLSYIYFFVTFKLSDLSYLIYLESNFNAIICEYLWASNKLIHFLSDYRQIITFLMNFFQFSEIIID